MIPMKYKWMNGKKKGWLPLGGIVFLLCVVMGCQGKTPYDLSVKNPVTVTIWHYYSGVQKEAFDHFVRIFNEDEGRKKGIVVKAFSKGSIEELGKRIDDSIEKKIGSEALPDVIAAYADKAYEMDQLGLTADLDPYLTMEEISEYVDVYMDEGRFDEDGSIKVYPVAKSTEILSVNITDWNKFAAATGETEAPFQTWEGITKMAKSYYQWSDSLTEEPNDGKAFFGRDAFANYIIIGSKQLGHEIFQVKDGKTVLDFDKNAMSKLWECYYIPYINGYFGAYGMYRSDDVKTGRLVAFVGATSGASYFPQSVTLGDGTSYEIENKLYPLPNFSGTVPCAVSQGAGLMVFRSDPKKEYAAVCFLKWFTGVEQNLEFSTATGYLPVKKAAADQAVQSLKKTSECSTVGNNLLIGLDLANRYTLYTSPPFYHGEQARKILNTSMAEKAEEDYKKVRLLLSQGMKRERAVSAFESEENFNLWYEDTKKKLVTILGE
ncbi:extracellular solute-binding protein [Clostridium sp. E02]|uniref:extracellular solute-binding protein n=1 Tax=Clostridium sp. E02 TaxID=2487134 RepID=UPI001FAAB819|nr:extracellular solute-binding protein [Clostridium sp. E02]